MGNLIGFFEAGNLIGLRAFSALNDVELYFIAFFEAFVAFALDGAVVNEDVCSIIAAEEAITLRIVEPLYRAFILSHWNNSLSAFLRASGPWGTVK
jgi:NADH:ubiquinone oxidoreductase subunit K